MVRFTNNHLNDIYGKLSEDYKKIKELRKHVMINFQWNNLPQGREGNICAVDGSSMKTRLCGGIIYAISANALGRNIDRGMFEMNILSTSNNYQDRIRRLMMTMEYRIGSIVGKEIDLLLMDGTLGGALIPPTLSFNDNPLNTHPIEAKEAGRLFIKSLNVFYDDILEDSEGNIYENTLLSSNIFQKSDGKCSDYIAEVREFFQSFDVISSNYVENWKILLEYIEFLHALNKLLEYNCVFISKTFYASIISDILMERGIPTASVLDAPLIDRVFPEKGYLTLEYNKKSRLHINNIYEAFMDEFQNIGSIGVNSHKNLLRTYCRFVDGGNLLAIETLRNKEKSLEEIISLVASYSTLGYPLYLRDAHHRTKISKKEFDSYVSLAMNNIGKKNNKLINFFQNGRSVL